MKVTLCLTNNGGPASNRPTVRRARPYIKEIK